MFPCRKKGFLTENSLGKWFWTPKPSFPENGDSGLVWGQGNPKSRRTEGMRGFVEAAVTIMERFL